VIEYKLTQETTISNNQFGFMSHKSIMEAIFLHRHLMVKYKEACKDIHMAFIDLEKAYKGTYRGYTMGFRK
jgi:hypothetical protein